MTSPADLIGHDSPGDVSRRSFLGLVGLTAAAVGGSSLLAACGPSGGGGGATPTSLKWVLGQAVPTLDVAKSAGAPIPLLALSHETLVRLDKNLDIVPVLAESWTQATPTTLVYRLRQGVKFWDGTPLTADDIAYSVGRHLDPKVSSLIASLLANFDDVSATAPDELTITLRRPDPTAKYLPALCHVTPRAFSEKAGDQLGASGATVMTVGSGPYVVSKFDAAVGVEYSANTSYWGEKPRYEKISIDFIADANARQLAIRGGAAQGTMDVPVVAIEDWRKLPSVSLQSSPPLMSAFLALNVNRPPFDDVRVRRALAHAVDREGFVQALVHGEGEPANGLATPAQWTNLADEATVKKVYDGLPTYSFDLDKARQELAASGHPDGFSVSVRFPDANPHLGRALVSLSEALRSLNIDLTVEEAPMAGWRSELMNHDHAMNVMLLRPNYPDPTDFLNLMLPSVGAVAGQYNIAEYRNDKVDDLMARQAAAEGQERVALLTEVLQAVGEDLPYIPLWWESSSMAVRDELTYSGYSTLYYYQLWSDNLTAASG